MAKEKRLQGSCLGCRESWKDILATKCEHGVLKRNEIEYTYHTVGSGITKGNCYGYKTIKDYEKARDSFDSFLRVDVGTFDEHILDIENEAIEIIAKAGRIDLPDVHSEDREYANSLLYEVKRGGFRGHIDEEWYAATILSACAYLRDSIARGEENKIIAVYALSLGMIVREADIRFKTIAGYSRVGGRKSKFDPVIMGFVKSRLKKTPAVTAKTLLEELSDKDPFGGAIRVGNAKLFAERDRIKVFHNGKERSISFSSLPRYVTEARKKIKQNNSKLLPQQTRAK